jgi:uncharacterized RDD family membrane protein YckC
VDPCSLARVAGVETRTGTGSRPVAPLGRRVVALCIDWAACLAISAAFFGGAAMVTLAVFAVENVVLVSTLGMTLGHRLLRLRVIRVAREATGVPVAPGLRAGALRTVLLCLVVPAAVWDADGRGMHDRLAGTVIVHW